MRRLVLYKQYVFENKYKVGMLYKTIKNTVKYLLGKGVKDGSFIVSQTPSDPKNIVELFQQNEITNYQIFVCNNNKLLNVTDSIGPDFKDYGRLPFKAKND